MPLAEVANSLNMDQGPSSLKRPKPEVRELQSALKSSTPTKKGTNLNEHETTVHPCTPPEKTSSSNPTPSKIRGPSSGITNHIENHTHPESKESKTKDGDSKHKTGNDVQSVSNVRNGRRVSLPPSLTATAEDETLPEETNDAVATIAVAAAAAGKEGDAAMKPRPVDDTGIVPTASISSNEQPQKQPSPPKETAIHTRDIKMTDDDALLGDVPWTMEQHKQFVAAIFEVGLKTCSPSVIIENMRKKPKYVTRERTKSHLQKYRITKDRNKDDFLMEYDTLLRTTEEVRNQELQALGREPIPKVILSKALNGKKATKLIGGQAAALLSFSVLNNCSTDHGPDQIPFQGTKAVFPKLTEEEQQTSLGASLLYVKGLLHNMTDVLLKERHGLSNSVTKRAVKDYDSESSSEEEEYSDFEDEDSKTTDMSVDQHSRKPSPETAAMSQLQQYPGMSHPGPYGYPGAFSNGHPGTFPPAFHPQGAGAFPQFSPYAFNGPGPARTMAPYSQHAPPFNQGTYPHAPPPPMNHPYQQGPLHLPSFAGHYPQSHADYCNYGQEQYPPSTSVPHPYPDDLHHDGAYPDPVIHQQSPEQPDRKAERSTRGKTSSRDLDRPQKNESKHLSNSASIARNKSETSQRNEEVLESHEHLALDNLFASPLVADKKRKRKNQSRAKEDSLGVYTDLDEDRGIPGASKVASPFHREAGPSPITSNAKRRRIRRPHREQLQPTTPPASERATQEALFMDSPFNEVYQAIQSEDQKTATSNQSKQAKSTPTSSNRQGMDHSPDWMFAGAHLSPGELSVASRVSHDGHKLVWEPLAIDMNEHLMDHSRPSLSLGEAHGSPGRATRADFDPMNSTRQSSSPDTPASTSKRSFFKENKDSSK